MKPVKYNTKIQRLEARVSQEQKELYQYAASLSGRSLTDFMIQALQESAKNIIQDHQLMHLSRSDQEHFVQALFEPSKPNKNLINAVKRHKKEIKD